MLYRKLGSSDPDVSVIGLGAIGFGSRITEPTASARIIHTCLDLGVNFIDAADAYGEGKCEAHIGEALRGRRKEAIIATKFKLSSRQGQSVAERIASSIEASLKKLQTDYVDLYQIHHLEPDVPHEEILGPLNDLVQLGKVRYIGQCNYSAWRHAQSNAVSERKGWAAMVSAQSYYNVLRRHVELELLPFCTENNVGFIPYRPLAWGWLSGKYRPGAAVPEARSRIEPLQNNERARAVLEELTIFARERGRSVLELAFAWLLAHPAVSTVIAGATTIEQVAANAGAADWQMSLEERDAVDAIAAWDGSGEEVEEPGRERHGIGKPQR
jgi:aryl-alcohol dehydrogenase-like predicted oxidoreductase